MGKQQNTYSLSDPGRRRDNNEDCFLEDLSLGLWAVADGMGGHEAGEVASAIAIKVIREQFAQQAPLADAIQAAHQAVLAAASAGCGAEGMGSTIVALSSDTDHWHLSWVGDSRAYLWTSNQEGGQLQQLSADHSYVQMLYQSGAIEAEDMESHPSKHVITQCLGSTQVDQVKVDNLTQPWQAQQTLLLCSDGLSDELSDESIAEILCQYKTLPDAGAALLNAALSAGGKDNITLQLIGSPLDYQACSNATPPSNREDHIKVNTPFPAARLIKGLLIVAALAGLLTVLLGSAG